ncbi:MAG: hypothetical protein H6Q15_2267 [Bacteroidetes bacterium]|nr:hypothetical protein [Bacteroidota bacterium]
MTKTLKEIGANINLKGFVIHQIIKEAGDRHTILKEANELISITKKEKQFVGKVNKAYNQKSGPVYGIFGDEDHTFKSLLETYCLDNDFLSFSSNAIKHYKVVVSTSAPATGGFVIFAHFLNTDNNNDYILVLTINNKDGYVVSEVDLTIKDVKNLDLSKVDVACIINLTKWKNIKLGADLESKTYLSFVKGNKDVSYYFMSFIDCADKTTSTESTKRLITAVQKFLHEKGYERTEIIKKRNDVSDYCNDCLNRKKEISLSSISALLNNEQPDEFKEFAAVEEYGVSEIISGDKAQLRRIKYVYYKDNDITVGFDNSLLGKDVIFDKSKKQLIFKHLPLELIKELEK